MKIKNLLILGCLILGINSVSFAQTNLVAGWNGNGAGTGAINEYGWDVVSPTGETAWSAPGGGALVIFDVLNGGGVRFRDVTEATNTSTNPPVTLNGANWTGRILYIRWDANGQTLNHVYSYPVTLRAGAQYNFSMMYHWWDNGEAGPTYTVSISKDKLGTQNIATQAFTTPTTKREMQNGTMPIVVPSTPDGGGGQYYVTFKSSTGSMLSIASMSLVQTVATNSAKDLLASNYTIYPNPSNRADGLFIAANNTANEAAQLFIYNVTGQLQKKVDLKAAQDSKVDISDLAAGMYVAKVVTSKGSFNKTLVVK